MAWEIFLETFGVIEPKSYEKVKKILLQKGSLPASLLNKLQVCVTLLSFQVQGNSVKVCVFRWTTLSFGGNIPIFATLEKDGGHH